MENKNLILGILFVAFLLFGCLQQEVETPDVVDDFEDETSEEEVDETTDNSVEEEENINTSEEDEDEIPKINDDEIIDELISQRCVYNDGTGEVVYLLKNNKIKMSSSNQGLVMDIIIDGETGIMYDKGGLMLMGMRPNCDWVKYDFNVIQAEMKAQGMASEDEDLMGDMVNMDDNVVCTNLDISDNEFIINENVCDGTNKMLELMSMVNQYNK